MPDIIGAAAQEAGGRFKGVIGLIQSLKANKLLKNIKYPTETLPEEFQQNQNLAQTMAATGMPSEQYNLAMKNIQRQQLMALRSANDRRGGLNILPQILQGGNDATLKLDANNAAMRIQNQRNLIGVNNYIGGQKRDLYDKNIRQKYLRDYNYAMSLKGMGNQNMLGSVDQMLGAGATAYGNTFGNNNYGGTPGDPMGG